jgi:exosortase
MDAAKRETPTLMDDALHFVSGLRKDLAVWWRQQPDKLLFGVLFVAWVALFQFLGNSTFGYVDTPSLFRWMYYVFTTSADDDYCLYVPLVVAALLIWKRHELMAAPKQNWWPALFIVLLALGLHVLGYRVQQTRISIIAFFLGLYGLTGLVWGRAWLHRTAFPMFLFVFCVPLGTLADQITLPLRLLVTKISVGLSHDLLGVNVFCQGSQIFDGSGKPMYDVAPACSGIRSLVSLLALMTIYAFVSFGPAWKRAVMIAASVPLAILANVVRITAVIIVGEAFGQKAGALIEQKFGFVTFGIAVICALVLGHWLRDRAPAATGALAGKPA